VPCTGAIDTAERRQRLREENIFEDADKNDLRAKMNKMGPEKFFRICSELGVEMSDVGGGENFADRII